MSDLSYIVGEFHAGENHQHAYLDYQQLRSRYPSLPAVIDVTVYSLGADGELFHQIPNDKGNGFRSVESIRQEEAFSSLRKIPSGALLIVEPSARAKFIEAAKSAGINAVLYK